MFCQGTRLSCLIEIALFLFLFSSQSLFGPCASASSVHIGLHASWPHTMCSAEATAWIVNNMGNAEVTGFLKELASQVSSHVLEQSNEELSRINQVVECEMVQAAFSSGQSHPAVSKTLSWVLQARQYSPLVHLHYSIANETLSAFADSDSVLSVGDRSLTKIEVFGVKLDSSQSSAELLLQPSHIQKCEDCAIFRSSNAQEHFSSAIQISGEVSLSDKCASNRSLPMVIIYANLASVEFDKWLRSVDSLVDRCNHRFVLRFWRPPYLHSDSSDAGPGLQGFTVRATLKSTEYKVIDDRVFSTKLFEDSAYDDSTGNQAAEATDEFSWPEEESPGKLETYTGLKAFRFLTEHPDGDLEKAIALLQAFTEDAPSVVRSNVFTKQEEFSKSEETEMIHAIRGFRETVGDGDYLFINGRPFDLASVTQGTEQLFRCLSMTSIAAMRSQTISSEYSERLRRAPGPPQVSNIQGRLRVHLDFARRLNSSLVWFNDLLKDSRYKTWKPLDVRNQDDVLSFRTLVQKEKKQRSGRKGDSDHLQLVKMKSHHLSLVVLLDPGDVQQFPYTGIPQSVVRADLPIRVGVALIPNGRVSSLITASFHYFLRLKGRKTCARFLQMIQQVLEYVGGAYQQMPLSEQIVELAFQQIASEVDGEYGSAGEVLERDEDINAILDEARAFAEEKGLFTNMSGGTGKSEDDTRRVSMLGIFNGIVLKDISADVIRIAIAEQERIATLLNSTRVLKEEDASGADMDWIAADPTLIVVERLSREMKAGDQRSSPVKSEGDLKRLPATMVFSLRGEVKGLQYLSHKQPDPKNEIVITVWLAGADRRSEPFKTAREFMQQVAASDFALRTKSRYSLLGQELTLHAKVLEYASVDNEMVDVIFVINGRIVPFSALKSIEDLKVEIASEYVGTDASGGPADARLMRYMLAEDVTAACSSMQNRPTKAEPLDYDSLLDAVASANISDYTFQTDSYQSQHAAADFAVYAVINPFGRMALVASNLLAALRETYGSLHFAMTVAIVPVASQMKVLHDLPSTYSKFVIGSRTRFHETSGNRIPLAASFHRLPENKVLTIAIEPPRAWFVSSFATNYDMDNIVLASLPQGTQRLHAEYELKNLIVEGSCVDEEDTPPQGLKLILENESGISVDTVVMANLGYFQLKVPTPGRWSLRLAPGPSSEIFSLRIMEMYSGNIRAVYAVDSYGRVPILVESLGGAGGILLRVERKPGMEEMSVLDPNRTKVDKKSVTERLTTTFTKFYRGKMPRSLASFSGVGTETTDGDSDRINVFSVASGHLYERFLKIMMTSVTKHASRPVKFWLLENYLSPSFKKMLPFFAKNLGCEVGMVTYKWPGWLRSQTEKQRIIWAYKILFLDVLFPLDVGRIIFVDSDQVVRGDLAELMDIDLEGAPYGYVPFCDSRKEVEGYRFWKQGFWKETLRGAKYRISALYVVDLVRFRETAAGDTLRFIYQSLSADPNSLSNLDQDLPNYASVSSVGGGEVVPIFDLPADWLWCESWCDDESKKTAKTIDLCNNPMTKEPKLESAKRIISEWQHYDDASSRLTEDIYNQIGGVHKDSKSLAGTGDESCGKGERCSTSERFSDSQKVEL